MTEFTEWLAREMPPGTVISDPRWWAPRIAARFAERHIAAGQQCKPTEKCEAGLPDCGPVEHWDVDSVPLCRRCWGELAAESEAQPEPVPAGSYVPFRKLAAEEIAAAVQPKPAGAVPLPEPIYADSSLVHMTHPALYSRDQLTAYGDAREAAANAIPRELWDWLIARELLPPAEEDGSIIASEIVSALNRHEAELIDATKREAAGRAGEVPEGIVSVETGFEYDMVARAHTPTVIVKMSPIPVDDPSGEKIWAQRNALANWLHAAGPLPQQPAAEPMVFTDINPEAQFIEDGERLNCPKCGGSGHIDDAAVNQQMTTQGEAVEPFGWWLEDCNGIGRFVRSPTAEYLGDHRATPGYSATPLYTHPSPVADVEALTGKYAEVLRPFIAMMEHELHANAGKGDRPGWLAMSRQTALLEIYYHVAKLQKAAKDDDTAHIGEHAADVANMAMMLADKCDALLTPTGSQP